MPSKRRKKDKTTARAIEIISPVKKNIARVNFVRGNFDDQEAIRNKYRSRKSFNGSIDLVNRTAKASRWCDSEKVFDGTGGWVG